MFHDEQEPLANSGADDADDADDAEDPMVDFTPSIFIPGLLHIVSSITQGVGGALIHYSGDGGGLNQVRHSCRLLSRLGSCKLISNH